jgi:hypothetical protein
MHAAGVPRAFPPRVPTLCRLVCQGFEVFLADCDSNPRLPGLIPRSVVAPWWKALTLLCGAEMERFERRLKTIIGTGEFEEADQLAIEVQKAAIQWTRRAINECERQECDPSLREIFTNHLHIDDMREIVRLLPLSGALRSQINLAFSQLAEAEQMEGRRILDLSGETIAMLKHQYLGFAERCGAEARYLALAVLNRMVRPGQILMLGRALGWRPGEPGSACAEFDAVAGRLFRELQRQAHEIATLAASPDCGAAMPKIYEMTARYLDEAEHLANQAAPRNGTEWAALFAETQTELARAFDADFFRRVARCVFDPNSPPDAASLDTALAGAHFLSLLLERGSAYEFAGRARDTVTGLAATIEATAQPLIEAIQTAPGYPSLDSQLQAMLRVTEIMFKDGHGAQLARGQRRGRAPGAGPAAPPRTPPPSLRASPC